MNKEFVSSLSDVAKAISGRDDICVCGHINPDGDSIGSTLALYIALKGLRKNVTAIVDDLSAIDASLATMPHVDDILQADDSMSFDTFISVDVSDSKRLGKIASKLHEDARFSITIDHHEPKDPISDITFTDPESPSTTCLIWDLCKLLDTPIDKDIATCAYTGLMTDTGRFQYSNTTPYAFECAKDMSSYKIDIANISTNFFQNKSLQSLLLERAAIDHLKIIGDGDIAFSWISLQDMEAIGAKKSDCEGLIDVIRSLGCVRIACILKESVDNIRGSIRSKDGSDVSRIAAIFGGGGHKAAAGFTIEAPLGDAIKMVERSLLQGE